jgi:hypothetical protein
MNPLKHLLLPDAALSRRFPSHLLSAIEKAVEASERTHRGEIRFAIEAALDWRTLWRVSTPRERALEAFGELEVWDTRERTGVLIYVLLAERDVEIVADRGLDDRVTPAEWQRACELMEQNFREGRWGAGALAGVEAVTRLLVREYPASGPDINEQLNRPALL